jgi:amino acid adenylation domain-containing protein
MRSTPTTPAPTPLRQWLRRAAAAHADAPALVCEDARLSYAELLSRVGTRAKVLRSAGLEAGQRVAIAAERSIETVVELLAAVECGLCYVPLDPAYPDARLSMMLEDAAPRAVLGADSAVDALAARIGALPRLDSAAPHSAPHAGADALTYVLFTSGSTGRPKGVAMGPRPLEHLIDWHAAHSRLGRAAVTAGFAPLSFDVHFQEIFSTLACGGCLVLLTEAQRRDPEQLLEVLRRERVQRLFLPYVALQMLAEACADSAPLPLEDVISAGEQLQVTAAIRALFERCPDAGLHNHYGPTESHVVTAHELYGAPAEWPPIPPIGKPLPHVKIALAPIEDAAEGEGELLLGGDCLAEGYLGRPELDEGRFVDSAEGLAGRAYRTGDRVRLEAEGVLHYLGRADAQLKIDGFRIEPGEVELALLEQAELAEAAVGAAELPGLGKQLVAWVVAKPEFGEHDEALFAALRAGLDGRLPAYMQPARYVRLPRLPTTPSGKINRRGLPAPVLEDAETDHHLPPRERLLALWRSALARPQLGLHESVFEAGARSLTVLRVVAQARAAGLTGLSVASVYAAPSVAGQVAALEGGNTLMRHRRERLDLAEPIAIIGWSLRAAGCSDVEDFWQRLLEGFEGISFFKPDELDASLPSDLTSRPNFVAARGVLPDADRFDAGLFGLSAREATLLDPQQRMLLELSWTALEDARIDPAALNAAGERIGVWAGTANNSYTPALRAAAPSLVRGSGEFAVMLGAEKDYAATRIAHRLDLRGPAVSVHTACSTGLIAVAEAVAALRAGRCELALAGGASLLVPQAAGYLHVEGGMESADGHCRPFDADASGTVFASAGALVVLKPLSRALADGDHVHAVIRGVGVNNDGADKASFTAPSVGGQAECVRMALDEAGISAADVGYIEAHGTGTALGDPIEVAGLQRAFAPDAPQAQSCVLGSAKSNFGHTIAAAGVLGLIKAALSLEHGRIPGTLHYARANPQIDFAQTPFKVSAEAIDWPRGERPRHAGVSSFGVGGTNAHVLLSEAPTPAAAEPGKLALQLFPLSAADEAALGARAVQLVDWLETHADAALAEVQSTLVHGRRALPCRRTFVGGTREELIAALRAPGRAENALTDPRIVFVFPGQGSQSPGMAAALYAQLPAFAQALDDVLEVLTPRLDVDLRALLLEDGGSRAAAQLAETRTAQPALFAMEYALTRWLAALGFEPDAAIGHSLGEYAAAVAAGVLSMESAARAVCARGAAMWAQPRGGMLAVRAAPESLESMLGEGVEIAGYNAPQLTVVSGPAAAIDRLEGALGEAQITASRLLVSHGFHSAAMEGALDAVRTALAAEALSPPRLPVYSCVSGAPLTAAEATDPDYWARQVRAPVRFSKAVSAELVEPDTVFIEVGPGQALSALLRQHRDAEGRPPRVLPLLPPARPGSEADAAAHAVDAVGRAWALGARLAWPAASARAPLPTYPFADTRFWFKAAPAAVGEATDIPESTSLSLESAPALASAAAMSSTMADRLPRIQNELRRLLADVAGLTPEELQPQQPLIDQGLDSLSLTQATLELERVFGTKLRFRRLMEDLDSVDKLAAFFDAELPPERFAAPAPAAPVAASPSANPAAATAAALPSMAPIQAGAGNDVLGLLQQQMALMQQQLAVLAGSAAAPAAAAPAPPALPAAAAGAPLTPSPVARTEASASSSEDERPDLVSKPFGASARITVKPQQQMSAEQRAWLDDFTGRYLQRSGKSREFSQQHRARMADPRVVTGFNPLWKDLVYPIVADRSDGARIWDIDGNEYIDLLSCFGANLLGYQPKSVIAAMHAQLERGIEVGPQHPLAAEVSDLISEFTGHPRVAFCNTGSEAVMGAMRVARTVTGRKTIAIFTNSYHGIFDEVIVRGSRQLRSLAAAPGILANAVENVLVLDYASEDSLKVLRERGHELAAIMIEPVQNKYPTLQPREFVHALRQICDEAGCALIFDEVVTGFRLAPGGAQQFYGVRADLCTYGKIIGGGLPFAAIGGGTHWMDALDGGFWRFGDDSYPEAGVTYFAGTFVRHPLALAAAQASLQELKRGGQAFYDDLNARTQGLIDRLNQAFDERGAPVHAVHCASLWRLHWDEDQKYVSLFYYLCRYHGLHLFEQFGHFVTAAMGAAELDRIAEVFIGALDELMALDFIAPRAGTRPSVKPAAASLDAHSGPLAPGQAERWLAASYDEAALRALDESFRLELSGEIDHAALEAALREVCARHAAFRLRIESDAPTQTVEDSVQPRLEIVDLEDASDPATALSSALEAASQQRFALGRAPMLAMTLFRLGAKRAVLHMIGSHLVFDGWAASVFLDELAACYRARCRGEQAKLPAAESPIAFARAESARMAGPEGEQALAFWREALRDPPAPPQLGDLAPPARRGFTADTLQARFEGPLFEALKAQAKRQRCTLYQLLLSAVAVSLRRLGAGSDLVLGLPYASQALGKHPALLGDGVLDLPLRLQVADQATALEILPEVRARLLDALEQPQITQGRLARALGIASQGDRPPLTGVYFNLNPRVDLEAFAPLDARLSEGRKPGLLSELIFNFYEEEHALSLDLHHSREHFSRARIEEVLGVLREQLETLAGGPDDTVGKRSIGNTSTPTMATAASPRIERRIAEQAARTPQATALIDERRRWSFGELEAEANRIAHALIARGVKPGDWVGLCLPRSGALVAALLGVLRAGAAYVPLDPMFPLQRLRDMAEDAGLALLLSDTDNTKRLGLNELPQLRLDADREFIAEQSTQAPELRIEDDAPAYVIYTSGSTGKPKGVVVLQAGVVNFLDSMAHTPGLESGERLLAVTTLSFDIAVLELLLPLWVGATAVIARRDEAADGAALRGLIEQHGIQVMQATPGTWHLLLESGFKAPAGFRALCGGEAMSPALARRLLVSGVAQLWNLFGPTETTVWSTVARITDPDDISVGTPIDRTVVRVLDEHGAECAVDQPGEICIGGAGVARGYHARPELTSERFIRDPFDSDANARLYRTGDLGAWRADGKLRHLGRLDHQVKLRGYRIELGEIEAALEALPEIGRAALTVQNFGPMDDRLVAHVQARPDQKIPALPAVRKALSGRLPEYMLPQVLREHAALPTLPNGKIDRKALAAEAPTPQAEPKQAPAPTDDAARIERIGELMGELLQSDPLPADANFFEQGGHSLLAADLAARLKREGLPRPSLRTLFEAPTPRALAAALGSSEPPREADAVPRRADRTRAPLSVVQSGLWYLESTSSDSRVNLLPSAHRLRGPLDRSAFERAFKAMVARQPALRTLLTVSAAGIEQQVRDSIRFELPYEDFSELPRAEAEAAAVAAADALQATPIDVRREPPFRAVLCRIGPDEHVFGLVVHHLMWDGWSFDLMYTELAELYSAELERRPPALPELAIDYGDYAAWQQARLAAGGFDASIAHFKRELLPQPPALMLPRDRAWTERLSGSGDSLLVLLKPAEVEQLHALAQRQGTTLFVLLLAAWAAELARLGGREDLVLGLPVRGRERPELMPVAGCFVNAVPLRLQPSAQGLPGWLQQVHAALATALGHAELPLDALVPALRAAGLASDRPLFESLFSFQDARDRITHWGPLAHSRFDVPVRNSTYPLGLWCVEAPRGLELLFNYSTDLFERERVQGWADAYASRLRSWLAQGAQAQIEGAAAAASDPVAARAAALESTAAASAPATVAAASAPATVAAARPPGEAAETLRALWRELLQVDEIADSDNFFELGGHSLLALTMVGRLEAQTGKRLSLLRVGDSSLAALAAQLESEQADKAEAVSKAPAEPAPARSGGWLRRLLGSSAG